MAGYNPYRNQAVMNELKSDIWIEQNIPGGLNSPVGRQLDNMLGGNPNPTYGQRYNQSYGYNKGYGYGNGYGYGYGNGYNNGYRYY
ncbi:unnamed protein product [Adineta steineri]|uniref:Uncharacterized protein n=1 Tax=Adineta steineri TaxID=433720 RepID=A0A815N2Q8_9BILA|nr:unnamed protein product [Adineta steineri]CAF1424007.1 unnamed protein product [Adineta steineri]